MMSSVSWWLRIGVAFTFLIDCTSGGKTPKALSVVPSLNWYGDDGTWSAISLRVGTPQQWIDVMVSTVSSETWVVGTGACAANDAICITSRGGHLFDPLKSSTWYNEGFFGFSADNQLGNKGYGWYGLDDVTFGSTGVTIEQSIIGSFNGSGPTVTTQYMLGLFGLGVSIAQFNNDNPLPALNALVEKNGVIPSHSYGYTAGAHYQQKGEPLSLTLGGYDANRLIPHNVTFNLNPNMNPQASINSVFVSSGSGKSNLTVPRQLLQPSDRVSAVVDSSTPFLWLPQIVCDRFAQALGLTYNDTLNLYTYDQNASQHDAIVNSQLSFTFSLSDLSSSPAAVNITLPFQAFDLQLTYPAIPNTTYGDPAATKYYFPLRRAVDDSQYTIGRAFLQEAYLITDFERNIFSVHQAVHTANPLGNTSIVSILQPSDSTFTSPGDSKSKSSLSKGAIIGIAVGGAAGIALLAFLVFFFCRRRRQRKQKADDEKISETETQPRSLLARILHRDQQSTMHEASGNNTYPTEIAADASHERFELPAPLGPAELDSEAGTTFDGTTEVGNSTQDSSQMSAYERARRKLERTQIAAAQAQAQISETTYPVEKNDVTTVAHYRAPDPSTPSSEELLVSPIAPTMDHNGWGTFAALHSSSGSSGQPSPVSPGFQSQSSPVSPVGPPPTYSRRIPLDPANVVYAGRLPDNVQLPAVVPAIVGPDGRTIQNLGLSREEGDTNSSLGSQFTVEEQEMEQGQDLYGSGDTNFNFVSPIPSTSSGSNPASSVSRSTGSREPIGVQESIPENQMLDPYASRRRLQGDDFVHVPQPAENRFSWEEDRISGREEGSL